MKKILYTLVFLILVGTSAWFLVINGVFASGFPTSINKLIYQSLCDKPIAYKIGNIDPRFNISKEEFSKDIEISANTWSKADGRNLFVFDPNAELTISMVYDERQTLNNQINNLQDKLEESKNKIDPQISEYDKRSSDFKARVAEFNKAVEEWNQKGGAPKDEYEKIIQEQKDLNQEAKELNQMARNLNRSTDSFNDEVNKLNSTVDTYNKEIKLKPEEGFYDGPKQKIDIYFNVTRNELVHTLTHELGHALGMDHNQNTNSIMYPQTTESLTPSKDDLIELQKVCAPYNIFEPLLKIINRGNSFG